MKEKAFFEVTKLIFHEFGIVTLMYGSLGLKYLLKQEMDIDDIDILIPEVYLKEKWELFINVMNKYNYKLVDEHEHCFLKDGIYYSYSSFEELETYSGIKIQDLKLVSDYNVNFYLLSLEQYLRVYSLSIKDGYRINVRKKKDLEKIALIKKHLNI